MMKIFLNLLSLTGWPDLLKNPKPDQKFFQEYPYKVTCDSGVLSPKSDRFSQFSSIIRKPFISILKNL